MSSWFSHWSASISILVIGGFVVYLTWSTWPIAIAVGVIELLVAWWVSPLRRGTTVPEVEARRRAESEGAVVIYWRPGCAFCARLRRSLGSLRERAVWVNIWADQDAAARVRGINDGNETVPTVLIGTEAVWTNPPPDRVRSALLQRSDR